MSCDKLHDRCCDFSCDCSDRADNHRCGSLTTYHAVTFYNNSVASCNHHHLSVGVWGTVAAVCAFEKGDWVSFTYNELPGVFVPWGYNCDVRLVGKCPK